MEKKEKYRTSPYHDLDFSPPGFPDSVLPNMGLSHGSDHYAPGTPRVTGPAQSGRALSGRPDHTAIHAPNRVV